MKTNMGTRYIVYYALENTGFYEAYYSEKESNQIPDIVAIFKDEEKAKAMVEEDNKLDYKEILWEE